MVDKEEFPTVKYPTNIRASGYCMICRERYTNVPVIDGVAACPRCYKIEE